MTALDIQTLFGEAKCYACYGPVSDYQLLKLALLRRQVIKLSPTEDVSAAGLMDYAKCYACYNPGSTYDLLELALLDKIAQLT